MNILSISQSKYGSLNSNVRALGGWDKHIILNISFLKIPAVALALRTWEQKGKKERGLGKGIFALLRLRTERFRFSLIKRTPKQKIFLILSKEKNGGRKRFKKCIENFTVLVRRSVAKASGNALIYSGLSLKKVRISSKTRSQIVRSAKASLLFPHKVSFSFGNESRNSASIYRRPVLMVVDPITPITPW